MIVGFWWQVLTNCLHLYIFVQVNGHLGLGCKKYVHMSKNNEIINNINFHLAINIVNSNSNFSFYFAMYWNHNVLMHHDIMYYVVFIMSPTIHMYFVTKGKKNFKIT